MQLKQREAMFVYVIVGLLGLWAFVKVIFGPFHEKFVNLGKEIFLQEARLKKGAGFIEQKEIIDREYAAYEGFFSLEGASDEEAVASFMREVERIGSKAGVVILDMKPQKEIKKDKISRQYRINVKAEASPRELVNFLYRLYGSSLLFNVEKLVLSPKGEESADLKLTLWISGVLFL